MGMFDSLFVSCPDCGEIVEFQSKAGNCALNCYDLNNVPLIILVDLDGEIEACSKCKKILTIRAKNCSTIYGVVE